ncbi:MAG: hypothetical protein ACYCZF_07885 [Anaerolineae bacterium]
MNAMSGLAAPISAYSSVLRWAQRNEQQINALILVAAPLPQKSKPPDAVSLVRPSQLERSTHAAAGLAAPNPWYSSVHY